MWHPWRHLREYAAIELHWADMDHQMGVIEFAGPTITLTTGMTQAERRSTLTHELVHYERGPCHPDHTTREEAAVDREAAKRLIGIRELGEALAWSTDATEIAEELWVDVATIKARMTYLHPAERAYLKRRLEEGSDSVSDDS